MLTPRIVYPLFIRLVRIYNSPPLFSIAHIMAPAVLLLLPLYDELFINTVTRVYAPKHATRRWIQKRKCVCVFLQQKKVGGGEVKRYECVCEWR